MADRPGLSLLALAAIAGLLIAFDYLPQVNSSIEKPGIKMSKIMGPSLQFMYW